MTSPFGGLLGNEMGMENNSCHCQKSIVSNPEGIKKKEYRNPILGAIHTPSLLT